MVSLDLRLLVRRLNDVRRQELEAAAGLALTRRPDDIEIEHALRRLVAHPGSDVTRVLDRASIDQRRPIARLDRAHDGLRGGNGRAAGLRAGRGRADQAGMPPGARLPRADPPPAPVPTPVSPPATPLAIIKGCPTVLIAKMPAARVGDTTLHASGVAPIPLPSGRVLPPGCVTVIIGR